MNIPAAQEENDQQSKNEKQDLTDEESDRKADDWNAPYPTWPTAPASRDLIWFPPLIIPDYMHYFHVARNHPNAAQMLQMMSHCHVLHDENRIG